MKNLIIAAVLVANTVIPQQSAAAVSPVVGTEINVVEDVSKKIDDVNSNGEEECCNPTILETETIEVTVPPVDLTPYQWALDTQSEEVIRITNEICPAYGVDPRLVQAMIWYESTNNHGTVGGYGDTGYMQVIYKFHWDRMERLGCDDLYDGYQNILVGTDYISELLTKYESVPLSLMAYNCGEDKACRIYNEGRITEYADNIITLYKALKEVDELTGTK